MNHLYVGPNFVFWETALGRFNQFFLIFCRQSTMVTNIFTPDCVQRYPLLDENKVLSTSCQSEPTYY